MFYHSTIPILGVGVVYPTCANTESDLTLSQEEQTMDRRTRHCSHVLAAMMRKCRQNLFLACLAPSSPQSKRHRYWVHSSCHLEHHHPRQCREIIEPLRQRMDPKPPNRQTLDVFGTV